LARDFERYATTVAAFVRLAMIRIMLRRLAANHFVMNPNFPDRLLERDGFRLNRLRALDLGGA
jgi:hypothetical protein